MENLTDKTIKDTNSVEVGQPVSPKLQRGEQIQAKIEKIVTAIFMVTDYIEKNEPIRPKLRAMCLDMISSPTQVGANEIMAIINVAKTMGLISEMNGDILLREMKKTKDILENSFVINLEKFDLAAPQNYPLPLTPYSPPLKSDFSLPSSDTSSILSDTTNNKRQKKNVVYKTTLGQKSDFIRKQAILNTIKIKKSAAINDIRMSVRGVSEKTIQRDLLSLMNEGLIKKEGEKRWSKYSLK